jgi:3-oxoacyl-[acyl-carrier-protein] synthase-3
MRNAKAIDREQALEIVRKAVAAELPPGVPGPAEEEDFVQSEAIDSMGWVGILSAMEEVTGIRNFGNPWPEGKPQSIRNLAELLCASSAQMPHATEEVAIARQPERGLSVSLKGWGYSLGSITVTAEQVEEEWRLPPRTIRERAGIHSVCRATDSEDEVSLAQKAAETALEKAQLDFADVDFLLATSTTFLRLPSLPAALHSRLLLEENCGALDMGGACAGLVHSLAVAKSLLQDGKRRNALIVASEVHGRRLNGSGLPGELCALFGDGACALVLTNSEPADGPSGPRLGDAIWGCSGTFAASLEVSVRAGAGFEMQFKGEQLAHAAVTQLDRMIAALESRGGKPRNEVRFFALHEPNPRIIEILAEKAHIPMQKIPLISRTCGNLGAATCGVSLCHALAETANKTPADGHPTIFMAAVAPGLIWGGISLS